MTAAASPDRLDIALIHYWLSTDAFWALGRSRETVERSVRLRQGFVPFPHPRNLTILGPGE